MLWNQTSSYFKQKYQIRECEENNITTPATPLACEKSPSQLLNGKLKIQLNDIIIPSYPKPSQNDSMPIRSLKNEREQLFKDNKNVWELGEVIKNIGKRHYLILIDSSYYFKSFYLVKK